MADSFTITVDTKNLDRVLANLTKPKRPLNVALGQLMLSTTLKSFRTEANFSGNPWVPLTPKYAKRKAKSTRRDKILQRTGRLKDTLSSGATEQYFQIQSPTRVGNHSLALIHQFGAPNANIPARPFLPMIGNDLEPAFEDELSELIREYLVR